MKRVFPALVVNEQTIHRGPLGPWLAPLVPLCSVKALLKGKRATSLTAP